MSFPDIVFKTAVIHPYIIQDLLSTITTSDNISFDYFCNDIQETNKEKLGKKMYKNGF